VKGGVRDWVLVTASELEDRITKVKCAAVHKSFRSGSLWFSLMTYLIYALSILGFMHATIARPQLTLVADAVRSPSGAQLDAIKAIAL
jgi:hypothetical protein